MKDPTAVTERRVHGFGGFRWTICALLFFATTINYMDRQILGILASTLQTEFGWNEIEYGHIVTAFQAAYAVGMLLFGRAIDLIGTKRGYTLAMVLWSLAAMGHALARSAFGFGVARFCAGLRRSRQLPCGSQGGGGVVSRNVSARWPPACSTRAPTSARWSPRRWCRG